MTVQQSRTSALSVEEVERFLQRGWVRPGRLLTAERLASLRDALDAVRAAARDRGEEFDLLDPAIWPTATGSKTDDHSVGYVFNPRLHDDTIRELSFDPTLARWAAQLIGARQVRILEDDAIYKEPETGGSLAWHQDFAYWPLGQPNVVSAWVALDDATIESGCLMMATGSHLHGERLPVAYHDGTPYQHDQRAATVRPIGDPGSDYDIAPMDVQAGEVVLHHALVLHTSPPNTSDHPRRALITRYVGDGTIWLGSRRYEFNYPDDEVGIEAGEPLGGRHFPIVPF